MYMYTSSCILGKYWFYIRILCTICCRDCHYHYSGLGLTSAYPGWGHRDSTGSDRGVYICICLFIYIYIAARIHLYTSGYIRIYMHLCSWYIHVDIHIYTKTSIYIHLYTLTSTYFYTPFTHIYTYIYTYSYIHLTRIWLVWRSYAVTKPVPLP